MGAILWAMLDILVMPLMGMGVFGSNGPGMKGAVAALLAHLVYRALLGGIAGSGASSSTSRLFDRVRVPEALQHKE